MTSFPVTRRSVVLASRDPDPEVRRAAFSALVEGYWKPVYKYLRIKWQAGGEEAQDLTQSFFLQCLEKGTFERYEPARARFRTFLRTCLDAFAVDGQRAAARIKRGGGVALQSLDFAGADEELARQGVVAGGSTVDMEEYFHREWVRALFARAVEELRRRCAAVGRERRFTVFARYDLNDVEGGLIRPSYAEIGAELAIPVTQVTNELSAARRELRSIVLDLLRELTGSEAELRAEARDVLGVVLP